MTQDYENYYRRELGWLRVAGREFATNPATKKSAELLHLDEHASEDPHTERILQAFAFLTARVQKKLEDDYPELTDSLLSLLYPSLIRPVPSTAIVEVVPDLDQAMPASGIRVDRKSSFVSKPVRGLELEFTSTFDLRIFPIELGTVVWRDASGETLRRLPSAKRELSIQVNCVGEFGFDELEIGALRLHLHGEFVALALHEALVTGLIGYQLRYRPETKKGEDPAPPVVLDLDPETDVAEVGFGDDEAMLPDSRPAFPGYRLLQEYFALPQKFLFFDFSGFEKLKGIPTRSVELVLTFDRDPGIGKVAKENLRLHCVPLVNLFRTSADPVPVSPFVSQHPVVPDRDKPTAFEVYSIESVVGVAGDDGLRNTYAPFYGQFSGNGDDVRAFWHSTRRPSVWEGDRGDDMMISLVDVELGSAPVTDETLHVEIQCTNRDMAALGSWGGEDDFQIARVTGIQSVSCLKSPTKCHRGGAGRAGSWRLVSQLALNYLSLVREGRRPLQQILRMYDFSNDSANQIEGIVDVKSRVITKVIQGEDGAGMCRGTETTLSVDRSYFPDGGVVLFAAVLERFLALYCATNTFSRLVLEADKDVIHRWNPRTGHQIIL